MKGLCECAGVSRQAYYQKRRRSSAALHRDMMRLSDIALEARRSCPGMGCRSIAEQMPEDWTYGRQKTERMLYQLGFRVKRERRKVITTKPGENVFPNLILGQEVTGVNQVWSSDMTYFFTQNGTVNYLIFIVDCYSQKIVAHGVYKDYPAVNFLEVLNKALKKRADADWKKLTFHSDRGSQYGSNLFAQRLNDLGIRQSMCIYSWENPLAEKVNDLIKNRYLHYWKPKNFSELQHMVRKAVDNHNNKMKKRSIGRLSPTEYEKLTTSVRKSEVKILKPMMQYGYQLVPYYQN